MHKQGRCGLKEDSVYEISFSETKRWSQEFRADFESSYRNFPQILQSVIVPNPPLRLRPGTNRRRPISAQSFAIRVVTKSDGLRLEKHAVTRNGVDNL
jgi:hypothetical protein